MAGKYADYEERMRAARQVDFDDLLGLCLHALETDDEFTATQRWRFRHLFVDEFQDVNPLQFQLLEAWRGERYDVCVVGDPQQAIYGWNGADASFLIDIRRHYPPVEVVALDRNYRSSPQILASAASALRLAKLGHHDIVAMRPDGPLPTVTSHPTDRDEAIAIARAVRDHHAPGARWGAQAVLVRTNAQSALIEEALRSANVPTRVRGGKDFLDRQEVRRAIRFLRDATVPLGTALADLEAELEQQDAGEPTIDRQDGLADPTANVEMLIRLGHDFVRLAPGGSPSGFVAWLNATIQAEGPDATGDAVDIATFHSAKGLEWPIVHLAGMEDGYVPITHARTAATRAEEARLLYVAMTRAERQLLCTWAEQRTFGARTVARVLSPLLADVAADRAAPAGPPAERVPDWRERVAEQRAMLAASAPRPGPALEALRRWRDEAARAARIEPATLLGDRLLEAVADQRPTDHEGLASIPGMGAILVARFGDAMLTALDATAGEEGAG
jgi:DNA helicase-2/ATP-dependent DNA helicase PcrA